MKEPLYQRYNFDGVFNRSVISGLLNLLNHKITYKQQWDDKTSEEVTVPFAYNFSQAKDQRFAQDNYTFFGRECFSDKFIDGKFDMLPRFAVTYTGSTIDAQNITNRFVEAKYQKIEGDKIESYTAYLYSIPLTMNFELEGWIDNYETAFKIEQKIFETFYKNQTFRVLYKGMTVNCCAGFPESIAGAEKTVSYSFEQENQLKMTFNIAVECYMPCFDESKPISSIEHFGFDVEHFTNSVTPMNRKVEIYMNDIEDKIYTAGSEMKISWNCKSETSDVSTVIIYYKLGNNERRIISVPFLSTNEYYWKVPQGISNFRQPSINFIKNDIDVCTNPEIYVKSLKDKCVVEDSFSIINPGKFSKKGYIQFSCENGNADEPDIHDCYIAKVDVDGIKEIYLYDDIEQVLVENGYDFNVMNNTPYSYKKDIEPVEISVGVAYSLDPSFFDEKSNILII